jgi:hypothetical protein
MAMLGPRLGNTHGTPLAQPSVPIAAITSPL